MLREEASQQLEEEERTDEQSAVVPFREWAELVPEPGPRVLDFEAFPFQVEWYSDEIARAEEVCWRKSTQIGMSAYAWRWGARECDVFGSTCLYIFPTMDHVTEFGDERIEPGIEASPYLQSRIAPGSVRHKKLKRIANGYLHLRGSNSKAGAQSIAARAIVFDEYDLLDQSNVPQIERRISGARQLGETPKIRRFGNPTLEGEGISLAFERSDQRVWHVTCEDCGLAQPVTWEDNVRWTMPGVDGVLRPGHDSFTDPKVVKAVWRQCAACEALLDVKLGEWIAMNPGASTIGYDVPRLIVPNTDLKKIVEASRNTKPMEREAFENLDLGRPYSGAESQLDQASLLASSAAGIPMQAHHWGEGRVTVGIDVAGERDLNIRISEQLPAEHPGVPNPRRALWVGTVDSFQAALERVRAFNPTQIVVDSNPERRMAKTFRASFPPGVVVLCEYDDRNESEPLKVEPGPPGTPLEGVPLKVRVNRTEAIDSMMDSIRQMRNLVPADPPVGYFEQMRSLKRKTELDTKGRPKRVYITTGTSGDDYAHAEVYDLIATELWRMRGGVVAATQETHIPDEEMGFRRVQLEGGGLDDWRPGFDEGRG